jgi:hypothetical protein
VYNEVLRKADTVFEDASHLSIVIEHCNTTKYRTSQFETINEN